LIDPVLSVLTLAGLAVFFLQFFALCIPCVIRQVYIFNKIWNTYFQDIQNMANGGFKAPGNGTGAGAGNCVFSQNNNFVPQSRKRMSQVLDTRA
jgi:hypothetical protein